MQRAPPASEPYKMRPRVMPRTILICGSPADGFQIVGLFADSHDAQSYAEDYSLRDWWIAELTSPEAFAESQRRRFRALRPPKNSEGTWYRCLTHIGAARGLRLREQSAPGPSRIPAHGSRPTSAGRASLADHVFESVRPATWYRSGL